MRKKSSNPSQSPGVSVPLRTCVACGAIKPRSELVRLVGVVGGCIEIDINGKKAGRGAYLCHLPECWNIGLKKGRLERTLRASLTADNREKLIEYAKNIEKSSGGEATQNK